MRQSLYPNDGVWTLAQVAAAIPSTPAALGVSDTARLRGVIFRDQYDKWTPFALHFAIGAKDRVQKGPITAGDLVLLDIEASARELGTTASLASFLQSWREHVPTPTPHGSLQDSIQIRRQPSDKFLPCWQFFFYERIQEGSQSIVPPGPFSNIEASFLASSAGDAAAQWLRDESLNEFSPVRAGIESRIWDPRAFFSKVTHEKGAIEVRVAASSNVKLECTALFRIGNKSEPRTERLGNSETFNFAVPKGAERCTVFLIGPDNFCYDQRWVWLQSEQVPGIRAEEKPKEKPIEVRSRRLRPKRLAADDFVDSGRINELRAIRSPDFDLKKLIRLCEELNQSWGSESFFTVAALTRTILDHVPPLFGKQKFAEVAANHSGGRSFRESMKHLDVSARKIADGHLHSRIRRKEVLPSRTQVNFSRDLDVLLAEIVRQLGAD